MPLDEPAWWYARRSPAASQPGWRRSARSTAGLQRARYCRATPYRSRLPVICVGNFTAGGTGKTPLAMHLCEHLLARASEPVALTRGYGGRLAGPHWVEPAPTRPATSATRRCCWRGWRRRWLPAIGARAPTPSRPVRNMRPSSSWTTACRIRSWPRTWPSPSSTVRAASATAASSRRDRCVRHSSSSSSCGCHRRQCGYRRPRRSHRRLAAQQFQRTRAAVVHRRGG